VHNKHGFLSFYMQQLLPAFKQAMSTYFTAMTNLGMRLLPLFALALGLPPDHFLPLFTKPVLFLRPLHYTALKSEPEQVCTASSWHCFGCISGTLEILSWYFYNHVLSGLLVACCVCFCSLQVLMLACITSCEVNISTMRIVGLSVFVCILGLVAMPDSVYSVL
jgi:hypothetical protein